MNCSIAGPVRPLHARLAVLPPGGAKGRTSSSNGWKTERCLARSSSRLATLTDFNAAKVEFDQSGTALTVTLTNTSTHAFNVAPASVLTPTNVLTGVLFDITGNPALTVGSANLASGSRMVNPVSSTDTSAKGWGFGTPSGGTFNGQHYGIEAFGGITPATSNFTNSNHSSLDGVGYGIVGSGYVPGTGNGGTSSQPFEQTAEVFHFTVPSTFDVSQISNISFQYGTNNGEGSPVISTTASGGGTVGSAFPSDTATLSGSSSTPPTGNLVFKLEDATNNVVYTQTDTVNGYGTYHAAVPTSTVLGAGTYHWVANYGGDSNNISTGDFTSATEVVTITKASPTLSTTPSATTITLGTTTPPVLTDSAKLSGGYHETGTITFTLYLGSTLVDTETATVSGNGTYTTPTGYTLPTTGTVTGTYQWDASFTGTDGNNNNASDNNDTAEQVTVSPASPTLVTTPSPTTSRWAHHAPGPDRLGHAVGRLPRDRHHHLHALPGQHPGGHRDGHGQRQRHVHHAHRLHAAHHGHGDGHLQWDASFTAATATTTTPATTTHGGAGDGEPGQPDAGHDPQPDHDHAGHHHAPGPDRLGHAVGRLPRDRHHHLHALPGQHPGGHRDGHGQRQRHVHHAHRLHAADHGHGDGHLQWDASFTTATATTTPPATTTTRRSR